MLNQEYRAILSRLPIKNPSHKDMGMLCPHLTEEEAVRLFYTGEGIVACPPLRVRGAFQIVFYQHERVEELTEWRDGVKVVVGKKNHPATLSYGGASRTINSYVHKKAHTLCGVYPATNEAIEFAEKNWGNNLVLDNWGDVGELFIQDPTDLVNDKHHTDQPRTKAVLYIALNRGVNDINRDCSKPESELLDAAIVEMSVDAFINDELIGDRGGFVDYYCANCGDGLSLSRCSGCGATFKDDGCRSGNSTPLSRKMVAFLRANGHKFKVDPEIAWSKEKQLWLH